MTIVLKNPAERTRFLKFAVVGLIGAVIDFGVMNLMVGPFHAPFVLAGTISFICAVSSNFIWNRFWTYPESRSKALVGQLGQFALVNAAGYFFRLLVMQFGQPAIDRMLANIPIVVMAQYHQRVSYNGTLAITVGIVMLWNFFVNRYWTYNDIDI
jgi:putative flippase GtrA